LEHYAHLILAYDGLEVSLVERWNFENLMQKCYGVHYVGFLSRLYTPIIWSCFLTGRNVEEHGYDIEGLKRKRASDALHPLLRPLYRLRRCLPARKLGLRRLLVRLGLARHSPPSRMPGNLARTTFLEILRRRGLRCHAIEVPGYNEERNEFFRGALDRRDIDGRRLVELALRESERRVKLAMRLLDEDVDVLMLYLFVPDIIHHLDRGSIHDTLRLHRAYWLCDRWTAQLKEHMGDGVCLIVSDHGFSRKTGYHTEYGFWSLNIDPPFKPRTVLDFHKLVLKLVGGA